MLKPVLSALLLAATIAATPNHDQMENLQYFVGTWHCEWQAGTHSGTMDQVFAPIFDGAWLEEREIATTAGRQIVLSQHYTGYDARAKEYVHLGPDADGSYEIAHSADGEVWTNSEGRFVFKRLTQDKRTMTATAPDGSALEAMTCTRAGT